MTSMTRGPLPASVYWRRRVLVLGLAVALVVVIARVLGGGSDGSSGADPDAVAEQAAGTPRSSSTGDDPGRTPGGKKKRDRTTTPTPTTTPLPNPTGPCSGDDIIVAPVVENAVADSDVLIALELRTRVTEACTWSVSPEHLTLKVTSGSDDIWSSLECPRSVPVQEVVVRQDTTATIGVVWEGARRSDPGCTRNRGWALPGYYHVAAAALGGEPADVQFRLAAPEPEVITKTTDPKPTKQPKPGQNQQGQNQNQQGQNQPNQQGTPN